MMRVLSVLALVSLGWLCLNVSLVGFGQETKGADAKKEAAKEPAKSRGRLPNHYSNVVTPEQKEKIYAIQSDYEEKILALMEQVKDLQSQRQTEIEALLSPEQKASIEKLKAEAAAKLKKPEAKKDEAKKEAAKPEAAPK